MKGISGNGDYFVCASFRMKMNGRQSSFKFVQLNGYAPCFFNNKETWVCIVMGMSVSKTLMSYNELYNTIRQETQFDIWGRLFKINHDPEPPSFYFKPFVVGFDWISSITEQDVKDDMELLNNQDNNDYEIP